MNSFAILIVITGLTLLGDYFIKRASADSAGLTSGMFILGAFLYGSTAVGWFFLMRSHSLTAIAVLYSSSIILLLAALGFFVFKEQFGVREIAGLSLAIASVVVMSYQS
jgi:drug/metabolite transporter (DMT)-like permease